ncbi:MAG: HAD-IC family P-type ATPase [Candidatus Moranbacteria bacterium]|nr:HAD-IC family P-type ATPase [Candidatus Moranbacteria bacterium]
MKTTNYYNKKKLEVFGLLKTREEGLSQEEFEKRLSKHGPNKLPEVKADGITAIFLRQFQSSLIFILLLAASAVFLMGDKIDGFIIIFVLIFNAVIGTIQEKKAQNIFASLSNLIKTNASVIRAGKEYIISDEELVPGDIISLREGEKVPADARVISARSLQINESALTGESSSKFKSASAINKSKVQISDQKNMVFKGTNVVAGSGKAVVVKTGEKTLIGDIAKQMAVVEEELPLKKDIRKLSRFIISVVALVSLLLLGAGWARGDALAETLSVIVAVAVSVVPEGLPVVVTLALAVSVWEMGRRNVLIKKLQAVEALGQVNVIAVDKTGTITKNELTVKEVYAGGKFFSVDGVGYSSKGEVKHEGQTVKKSDHKELSTIGKIASLCSSARIVYDKETSAWKVSGDPTEAATLVFSKKLGFRKEKLREKYQMISERPFDYKLKYHSTLHESRGRFLLSVVGAPEEILNISEKRRTSSGVKKMTKQDREELAEIFTRMSQRGLRVIAAAKKDLQQKETIGRKLSGLEFVGFLAIEDPPKPEVKSAIKRVKSAKISLVMITGDHKATAKAIAEKVGILKEGEKVLEGKEIDRITKEKLAGLLDKTSVFARVTPFHKLKIIEAYKKRGDVVAMTGDGVNDALSLNSANVGVAMGKIGTEVAKESSDVVLLDDNFGSIVSGVEEGRNVFKTIKRVILYLFSTSLGEVLTIVGAIFLGMPLPILAPQILWINLVTDGFLDVALVMEKKEKNLLGKEYLKKAGGFVDRAMLFRMVLMAAPMAAGTLFLFSRIYEIDLEKAWTVSFTSLVVFQWFNAWNCRSATKSFFTSNPFSNKYLVAATGLVIVLQLLVIYNPLLQSIFHTVPLTLPEWLIIIAAASSVMIIEEARKALALFFKK